MMSARSYAGIAFFLFFCLDASISLGHGGHSEEPELNARLNEDKATPWSRLSLSADLRPSSSVGAENFFMDNELALSYQISESFSATYTQRFQIGLNMTALELPESGPDFHEHHDGFLQVNAANFGSVGKTSLSYEGRLYAPTNPEKRNRGFVTALANFIKATIPILPFAKLCLTEGPVFHAYSQSEFDGEEGVVTNPLLENRMSVSLDFLFVKDTLRISFPIFWHEFFHHSSRQNGEFANSWTHALWISPEIIWKITDDTQVGVAYHSENLFGGYRYALNLNDGLGGGAFQVVYQISL